MDSSNKNSAYAVAILAGLIGGQSLILFGIFLLLGPMDYIDLGLGRAGALAVDAFLCLVFFIQHSAMIRRTFRKRLATFVPARYHNALYAIASGFALLLVVVFWQRSDIKILELEGALRWLPRCAILPAMVVFISGVRALGSFDTFGFVPLLSRSKGEKSARMPLTVRGSYRLVRHPLYFSMLMVMWSYPTLTADRLLFNVTWTVWIIVGTILEERDLVAAFGDDYRDYQRRVPMLIPWRSSKR